MKNFIKNASENSLYHSKKFGEKSNVKIGKSGGGRQYMVES
jgi:hypothetical protein